MGQQLVLKRVQYGLEAVHGTPATVDTKLYTEMVLPNSDREIMRPMAGQGSRVPARADEAFVRRIIAEGIQMQTPSESGAYFELLPVVLSGGIIGNVTPAEQTGGEGDYLWTFDDSNLTGTETVDSLTLQTAAATGASQGYQIAYALPTRIEITGNAETGETNLSATYFGEEITRTTLTGGAATPAFKDMDGKLWRLYVDNAWGSLGGTELANSLLDFTLTIDTGVHHKRRGSGQRVFDAHDQAGIEATLRLGLERGVAAVEAEEAIYRSNTPTLRALRLEIDSLTQIGAGVNHKFTVDLIGNWTLWGSFGRDQGGNLIDEATMSMGRDGSDNAFSFAVITDLAAL